MIQNKEIKTFLSKQLEKVRREKEILIGLKEKEVSITGFDSFFFESPMSIKAEYSKQTLEVDAEKVYLSLFERTTNFSIPSQKKIYQLVGDRIVIFPQVTLSDTVICRIYINFYQNENLLSTKIFKAPFERISVDVPQKATSYRFAFRLEGKGEFYLKKLKINQVFEEVTVSNNTGANPSIALSKASKVEQFIDSIEKDTQNYKNEKKDLRIAAILDEFSYECFRHDAEILRLSKTDWENEITEFNPHFVFIESCWQGNQGHWQYEIANLHINKHRTALKKLTEYCKRKNIKTVFWDKEGNENFEFFKTAASYFDYIMTADENTVEKFKEISSIHDVGILPFAAQPKIHNPINKNLHHLGGIAFAGSYYNNKHESRKRDIEEIIKPALDFGIDIYDRYYHLPAEKKVNNTWPEEYQKHIVGSLDYSQMNVAYKNYNMFVNVNSVQNSKHMFARRVFELLASKTMVISGPSQGVKEYFGELVPVSCSKEETVNILKTFLHNPVYREIYEKKGHRLVLNSHTYKNRLQKICDHIGLDIDLLEKPKVSIISSTQRSEYMENLYNNVRHQTYQNLELIVILNKNSMNSEEWKQKFSSLHFPVQILQVDENVSLGHCLNKAVERSTGEIIAKFDDDDYYAPHYLEDMLHSMDYSGSDIVGKSAHYVYLEERELLILKKVGSGAERYSNFISGATLVFRKDVFVSLGGFSDKNRGEDSDFLKRAKKNGHIIYSNDSWNFCLVRRANRNSHTWNITANDLLRNSTVHSICKDYKKPITI
ncbi:glycosyltransferase [Bacillus inaquosorum]|uniref:Glycosyl transferase family 2 n=1 Tax=Bacillus inaquosorum KCTC 13429 TaxID=1236548 RepID=A0A9W5LLE0_9BACI|nr:glycosyltransferase [Bacillus inaquosorum]RKQ25081.1 glycosyltransferase [Bacillus subtilis]AWM18667.1 glycosyl transferase family 2 [Bacillus inaquosorum]ELS62842.1 glycosyl transferase family 2 [Bacillus inaquosorum KCTC 13429]MCY7906984.1 glycosyltransferase [Bacillus inaquosorum]MCY7930798.1 glycosyltransferase [Bacillus inaquosorum]